FGLGFVLLNLLAGKLVRPSLPNAQKQAIYECGEPTFGNSWVQFDLRFYIVALFYLVFDVEVALIYPWAVSFRQFPLEAMVLGLPFIALVVIGYAYEWKSGSLDWVRSHNAAPVIVIPRGTAEEMTGTPGSKANMAALARIDPELIEEQQAAAH